MRGHGGTGTGTGTRLLLLLLFHRHLLPAACSSTSSFCTGGAAVGRGEGAVAGGGRCQPRRRRWSRLLAPVAVAAPGGTTSRSATAPPRRWPLYGRGGGSRYYDDDDDDGSIDGYYSGRRRGGVGRSGGGKRGNRRGGGGAHTQDEEEDRAWAQIWGEEGDDDDAGSSGEAATATATATASDFAARTDEALTALRAAASAVIERRSWKPSQLDDEKDGLGNFNGAGGDGDGRAQSPPWRRYQSELRTAINVVNANLIERTSESRLVVLGMVTGEHVLLLGPPGTGKSALGRRLSQICGGSFFQRLLTRFTTPEEIFGPLSLRALENDEYRRCTAGFLPTASVAFLDEIFKANSAILNTLLTILNERKFDNGAGGVREDCPVRCVVGASNELPDSDELDALYDRFLLRKEVLPVSDEGLVELLSLPSPGEDGCSSDDDGGGGIDPAEGKAACDMIFADGLDRVSECLSQAADAVVMGGDVCNLLRDLRTYMRSELDVDVSDRRLVKAGRLLRVSAASHGRAQVDPIDCLLLQHVVWRWPEQRAAIREWLWDNLTPGGGVGRGAGRDNGGGEVGTFRFLLDGLRREAASAVRVTGGDVTGSSGGRAKDVATIASIRAEVVRLASLLRDRADSLARHSELLQRASDHLWLDPDEAAAARQLLLPRALAASDEVSGALADATALQMALSSDDDGSNSSPLTDDTRLSVIEMLWDEEEREVTFTEEELGMAMKEAKTTFDPATFRTWKRARKKKAKA